MILRFVFLCLLVLAPLSAGAQETSQPNETADSPAPLGQAEPAPDGTAQAETAMAASEPDEQKQWERIARSAEDLARREAASELAIRRLRSDLVVWRDLFLARTSQNAARIATVDAQIASLGPVPESGEEPEEVAARRDALAAQRDDLIAPRLLAEEAFARANGLIGEFDAMVRRRQTAELTERGPSPLDLTSMAAAVAAIWNVVGLVWVETTASLKQQISAGRLQANLPLAAGLLFLSVMLLGLGRRWITDKRAALDGHTGRFLPLWLLFLSVAQFIVPVVGLLALSRGLQVLDIFGLRGTAVISAIPVAGFTVVFAWWLSRHIFPVGPSSGHLGYDAATRAAGRRYAQLIAWVLALGAVFDAALRTQDLAEGTWAAVEFPVLAMLGLLLWRFGKVIMKVPEPIEGEVVSQGRLRAFFGRTCTIVAIAAPVAAAFGFVDAGRAIIIPFVYSLALTGAILIVQRVIADLSGDSRDPEKGKGVFALLPVLISFVLYVFSLPLFALIWGARDDDLFEVWARFREGFSIGESRISPTDFLTFALVFVLGYLLTRFIQGTLRRNVLPRTRLDLGGQNAIVSGFGYIGIFLAAITAIVSAGIDMSNLAILAGALSVGIGFGLQNIVSNFVSGIILLIERPVSEGDWIEVGGQMGYVRAISVRSTRIETFDRTDVIIPNADLVSGQVTNWTRGNLVGRVIVPVGVAYGTDTGKVTEILREIAEAHPLVLFTPPPNILFIGFGADSLDFEIRAILRDVNYVMQTKSEMNHEIARRFAEAGIEIPFAQRDIWLRNPEVLRGGDA